MPIDRIRNLLLARPLGGLTPRVQQGFNILLLVGAILFILPPTHDAGWWWMILLLGLRIVAQLLAPEREIVIESGKLHLRTRPDDGGGLWSGDLAAIAKLRLIGPEDNRRLQLRMTDGSTTAFKLRWGRRVQGQVRQYLESSSLADRLEVTPAPSWMDELRGYDE